MNNEIRLNPSGSCLRNLICLMLLLLCQSFSAAFSQDAHGAIDWTKLNLSSEQSKQIGDLEGEWQHDYGQLKSSITEDQTKIAKLLGAHSADPVEIMALQSSIARKREQLSALAMAGYLKKRQVLTDTQQHTLENMMRHAIAEREHNSSGAAADNQLEGIMQRVGNIWTVPGEH